MACADNIYLFTIVFYSCQTYEGGFCGVPGMEAHGGYAFCGLAALFMLQKQHLCDLQSLLVRFASLYTKLFIPSKN